ncbi:MAG: enoyl-CoA hydratase [Rhodobacteraceae bacterium]|nr:enoyl-CoA hydratase [Paracoccaceae bacterium]MBR25542.1 enoyl-CoA hydratase [Paracoccaceae bacterium]
MPETIRIETDDRGVATLTLARPEKHNALNALMISELTEAAATLGADASVRAVVMTGEGKSFCAGGDLGWMRAQIEADRETRIAEAMGLARMLDALNTLPKPLIGKVNGQAFGGGMGMMSVCDVAVGAEGALFGFTEVRLGLIPATISPFVHAKMGEAKAREVFFSARLFDGAEAVRLGLLSRAVPADALDDAMEFELAPYLTASPQAVAASKALLRRLGSPIDETVTRMTAEALADAWETPDGAEGIDAFFARRKPVWPGAA